MKTASMIVMIVLMAGSVAFAQGDEYYVENSAPLQISIAPPLAFPPELNTVRGVRLDLVCGKLINMYGIDGGIANMSEGEMIGIEGAAFLNRSGSTKGLQVSLGVNHSDDIQGLQLALFLNRAKNASGSQASLLNIAADVRGAQIAPIADIAYYLYGFQGVAAYNGCAALRGCQVGAVNDTQLMTGAQIGAFLNVANQVDIAGLQLGPVNIAGGTDGFQVGFINVSKSRIMPFFNWPDD